MATRTASPEADPYLVALAAADDRWRGLTPRTIAATGTYRIRTAQAAVRIESEGAVVLVDPGPHCRIADRVDLIVVTHAHHDHTGGLFAAAQQNPNARIMLTPQTLALVESAPDGAAWRALVDERGLQHECDGTPLRVAGIDVRLHRAGHLLGCAMVDLKFANARILVTGDFTVRAIAGLPGAALPDAAYDAVVMECTHAWDLDSPTLRQSEDMQLLVELVRDSLVSKRAVVVEADALGKAQDVYYVLAQAVMRGTLKVRQIGLAGRAHLVAGMYAAHAQTSDGPWQVGPQHIEAGEHMPNGSVVVTPMRPNAKWPTEVAVLRPSGGTTVRPSEYAQSLHASWRELYVAALAIPSARTVLYHGPVHAQEIQPTLMKELIRAGRAVAIAEHRDVFEYGTNGGIS
jgi:glyoxylase-like metal-dependent hydrolase (beta-lactamase superfamily II)